MELCLGEATTGTRVTGVTTAATPSTDDMRTTTRSTATGEEGRYGTELKNVDSSGTFMSLSMVREFSC